MSTHEVLLTAIYLLLQPRVWYENALLAYVRSREQTEMSSPMAASSPTPLTDVRSQALTFTWWSALERSHVHIIKSKQVIRVLKWGTLLLAIALVLWGMVVDVCGCVGAWIHAVRMLADILVY